MEIKEEEVFHTRIIDECLPLFQEGHYKQAAFESMKQVEMALRERGMAPKDRFGDKLVNWVIGNGNHITLTIPFSEDLQDKALLLFKGAFSYYRNYTAHDGTMINSSICFRIMVLASDLLDLISASKRSFEGLGGIDGIIAAGIFLSLEDILRFMNFVEGQQFIEADYDEYESQLIENSFTKTQEEAMFDLGLIKITSDESSYDQEAQITVPLIEEIELTDEGNLVRAELERRINKSA